MFLVVFGGLAAAQDPPEVVLGERLFLETRFAQAFKARLDAGGSVNDRSYAGDPVMNTTQTTGAPLPGPFAGKTMNCRACHLVDEQLATPGGGMRTYNDFARRSPIPARIEDRLTTSVRNAPPLVNSSLSRPLGPQFHFDAEFASLQDLADGTLTGRNFGWKPGERSQAIKNAARIIRQDDGLGDLASNYGALSYATVFAGSGAVPTEYRVPRQYRLNVATASDADIFNAVCNLIAVYTQQLEFSRDENHEYNLSPFDVFLKTNNLPRSPARFESELAYSRRLLARINQLDAAGQLQFVTTNPNTSDGRFAFHTQPFTFGRTELAGLRTFFGEPKKSVASASELAAGKTGNCIACHMAPNFTDFRFHNTGVSQEEYDAVHGQGGFAGLYIPDLGNRLANPNAWLPATETHPRAAEPFRAIPQAGDSKTDLGAWNIFLNPDYPKPQASLYLIFCQDFADSILGCLPDQLLKKAIAVFKTPGLRDLGHSAPYMHTGRFDDLPRVLAFYRSASDMARAKSLRNAAPELSGIALTAADIDALVAFLKALNEDYS